MPVRRRLARAGRRPVPGQLPAASIGDAAWIAAGLCGAGYSLWSMADSIRHGRLGVDVIALLALVGALAVREYLAAAVISVMVASGRALEVWAAGRARRDLGAPRTARRYRGSALESVSLEVVGRPWRERGSPRPALPSLPAQR